MQKTADLKMSSRGLSIDAMKFQKRSYTDISENGGTVIFIYA
jgi:hypothetical protein